MPLGTKSYFDLTGSMSGYQNALMDLAKSRRTNFWDFLRMMQSFVSTLPKPKSSLEKWLEEQTGMAIQTGQEHGLGALSPFAQSLFERGTGLDIDWSGYGKAEAKKPERSILEQMRAMYTTQGPKALKKLYEEGKLSKEALDVLAQNKYQKMFPGVLPMATTEGAVPKFEQIWHWLGKTEKETPLGVANELKKQGYTVDPETGMWKPSEQGDKPFLTLGQIKSPTINLMGQPIPPSIGLNMMGIQRAERLAIQYNNPAQMEIANQARTMYGYPSHEDEQTLMAAIKDGDFGKTTAEIMKNLQTLEYSDEYITWLLRQIGTGL